MGRNLKVDSEGTHLPPMGGVEGWQCMCHPPIARSFVNQVFLFVEKMASENGSKYGPLLFTAGLPVRELKGVAASPTLVLNLIGLHCTKYDFSVDTFPEITLRALEDCCICR